MGVINVLICYLFFMVEGIQLIIEFGGEFYVNWGRFIILWWYRLLLDKFMHLDVQEGVPLLSYHLKQIL